MKRVIPIILLLVSCPGFVSYLQAQKGSLRSSVAPPVNEGMSAEEDVIRAAYAKLSTFGKAAVLMAQQFGVEKPVTEDSYPRFKLSKFRIGGIEEIMSARLNEIKTASSGDVVDIHRRVIQHNGGEESLGYGASWNKAQPLSAYELQWTVADIFNDQPTLYYDIGKYVQYEVTVTFQGKSRSYKALALFERAPERLNQPYIWDSVVGGTGTITQASRETLRPFGANKTGYEQRTLQRW
jgi:hypothetical protein